MPRPHFNAGLNVQFGLVLVLIFGHRHQLLPLVGLELADILASLVQELDVELTVGLVFDVNYVHVAVVGACEHHG